MLDENERLIETFTDLLNIIIRGLQLSDIDVLCQVTEILLTLIMMNRNCVDHQKTGDCSENRNTIPEEHLNNLRRTEKMVNLFLERELKRIHLLHYASEGELNNEFQVSDCMHYNLLA